MNAPNNFFDLLYQVGIYVTGDLMLTAIIGLLFFGFLLAVTRSPKSVVFIVVFSAIWALAQIFPVFEYGSVILAIFLGVGLMIVMIKVFFRSGT